VLVRRRIIIPRIPQCTHRCTHRNDPLPALLLVAISAPRSNAGHRRWSLHRQLNRCCLDRLLFSGPTLQLVPREKAFTFTNSGSTGNQLHHGTRNEYKATYDRGNAHEPNSPNISQKDPISPGENPRNLIPVKGCDQVRPDGVTSPNNDQRRTGHDEEDQLATPGLDLHSWLCAIQGHK
jgi:hypothetical protein